MLCCRAKTGQSQHRKGEMKLPKPPGINYISERILGVGITSRKTSKLNAGKKEKKGHLVSIKKIKRFTRSLLQAALLLGGVHAALSIIIQLT